MESASVPGGPAAAEPTQQQVTEPTQQQPAQSPDQGGQDDVHSLLERMSSRLDSLEGGGQQQGQPTQDLRTQLAGVMQDQGDPDLESLGFSAEEIAAIEAGQDPEAQQGFQGDQDSQQQYAELEQYVNDRVQQGVQDAINPLVRERQDERIDALQQKYPDIRDEKVFETLSGNLQDLVQRHGTEDLMLDPKAIELAYKAAKAEMADADAVPAEQAATNGASLETSSGQSQADGQSLDEEYTKALLSTRSGGDAFT